VAGDYVLSWWDRQPTGPNIPPAPRVPYRVDVVEEGTGGQVHTWMVLPESVWTLRQDLTFTLTHGQTLRVRLHPSYVDSQAGNQLAMFGDVWIWACSSSGSLARTRPARTPSAESTRRPPSTGRGSLRRAPTRTAR